MSSASSSQVSGLQAIAYFLRRVSELALDLADELDTLSPQGVTPKSLDQAGLGSLQRLVAEAPGMDKATGVSPRTITKHLERSDEPNVRTALAAMQKRGVTELVPGVTPQRWRLAAPYRSLDS